MGLRRLKQSSKETAFDCVAHSFGEVRAFLVHTPCKSMDRIVFVLGDDRGNSAVVSVAWVEFGSRTSAQKFKRLEDRHGTGDVAPLGSALLEIRDIHFTGRHYHATSQGITIAIAETETIAGKFNDEDLTAIAEVASLLPRP